MGCTHSINFHSLEKGIGHEELARTSFDMQRIEIIHDLDTDNDQKGKLAVDCIFRATREIYGQRALDMLDETITWSKFGISFHGRPFPHDFPAFAHEKPQYEALNGKENRKVDTEKTHKELKKVESYKFHDIGLGETENIEDVADKN
ncbi:unnamed protein product [Thelazia callipaeda]|uniref:AGC-kinase C-terminal domain-containing protein n=1 Tax=Thelazia callipaeda TaxID=103827 RepID=A0A0N5DBM1_THECL|nr:unnamed protein product [Thelazia callipaeda]